MIIDNAVRQKLSFLELELIDQILEFSLVDNFPANTVLIREGQYLKHIPVIIKGSVKVYSQYDDKKLLLYYIKPKQSCILSFAAVTQNDPSKILAVTEVESRILLLPSSKVLHWKNKYPRFSQLFLDLYHLRYLDLLETINQLLFTTLDQRLYSYLNKKITNRSTRTIKLKHHEIAQDLGTAREVVSRVLKKLENEGKIMQSKKGIKILSGGD